MSVIVSVLTDAELAADELLTAVAARGEQIVVTENEWPSLLFGRKDEALRGVEVICTNGGYDVRVCTLSSQADYELFPVVIDVLMKLTGGKVLLEYNPANVVDDPLATFGEDWVTQQVRISFGFILAMVQATGNPVTIFGMFLPICLGAATLEGVLDMHVDDISADDVPLYHELMARLTATQWGMADKQGTSTHMVLPDPAEPGRQLEVSAIYIKDGEAAPFDYISYADVLCIFDLDNRDKEGPILIPFKYLPNIISPEVFMPIDDYQMLRTGELDYLELQHMKAFARRFVPDDLFSRPSYPGQGDEPYTGRTFILRWNPAISNVQPDEIEAWRDNIRTEVFNWSVWDYEKARMGDRFYLLRVGDDDPNPGIVASGVFSSQPYKSGDWSKKGRITHYMNLDVNFLANPDEGAVFAMAELQRVMPDITWNSGHSGVLLPQAESNMLDTLWRDWLSNWREDDTDICTILKK